MVSSTFTDLKEHRAALIKAIKGQELTDVAMENDSAKAGLDVVESSLQMVRDGSAYIGVISRKYGQTPKCSRRNPGNVSITELEFNEAQRLDRPILLFVMGEKHPVLEAEIEISPVKRRKLEAFRERAKKMAPDSQVHRVYATFDSLEEFKERVGPAVASLRRYLDAQSDPPVQQPREARPKPDPVVTPPAFYAKPPYIGSHDFLGRKAELDTLSDWAAPADPHPILLFEAIGGAGKSLLTWEWTKAHATTVRGDWAGRFWYSFYEKGAIMADFCQHALAYITGQPLDELRKKKTAVLGEQLIFHLQSRPWLLVLDGLERVLVAYHRFDAAQLADEQVDDSKDQIANRDPCAAIRPEDDDLLRALAAAAPSKLLITTRLTPRILLNPSSQGIQGVLRVPLQGLRPSDAEQLLRAGGVTGDSQKIQDYLKRHCDCHPLVTGVLAGLVNNYFPDRGNFDAWADDSTGGGHLNLAALNLIQKRNHILLTALAALPEKSRQLLSTLALLSEAADYPTLNALNPHLPPEPEEVEKPTKPEESRIWDIMSDKQKKQAQEKYRVALQQQEEYEQAIKARLGSPEFLSAQQELATTVRDLEQRGLLQYDRQSKRYDLHPVVRGVAAGVLRQEEKEQYGQRVVDHFSRQVHNPYEEAETLEDVSNGLNIVRTLLKMGRYEEASTTYSGDLSHALLYNLEADAEALSLLRPFFSRGWGTLPDMLSELEGSYLTNHVAVSLSANGEMQEALTACGALLVSNMKYQDWRNTLVTLGNISITLYKQNRFAMSERYLLLGLDLLALTGDKDILFNMRLRQLRVLSAKGLWAEAKAMWLLLDPMGRDWPRALYRPGEAEFVYAELQLYHGTLNEAHLVSAEALARAGKTRFIIRQLHLLRGKWQIEQSEWTLAAESLHEAVRMAREIGKADVTAEALLLLAKFHLRQLAAPRDEAEQLATAKEPPHQALANLWLAMGDQEQAKKHALAAYKSAWADGEPHVHRYSLNKARALLDQLGAEIPKLPPYDPTKNEKLFWEDELTAAIEKLRIKKENKKSVETGEEE